eukprot:10962946-Lingulodinium_polyedra.AAC.1
MEELVFLGGRARLATIMPSGRHECLDPPQRQPQPEGRQLENRRIADVAKPHCGKCPRRLPGSIQDHSHRLLGGGALLGRDRPGGGDAGCGQGRPHGCVRVGRPGAFAHAQGHEASRDNICFVLSASKRHCALVLATSSSNQQVNRQQHENRASCGPLPLGALGRATRPTCP